MGDGKIRIIAHVSRGRQRTPKSIDFCDSFDATFSIVVGAFPHGGHGPVEPRIQPAQTE